MIDLNDKTRAQIVKSVVAAVRVSPDKLTKKAYDWLNKRGGFIAHYDHAGFVSHYASGEETRGIGASSEAPSNRRLVV